MSQAGIPVVLFVPKDLPLVAGFPPVVRTAHGLAFEDGVGPVVLVGSNGALEAWLERLGRWQIRCLAPDELGGAVPGSSALLVVAAGGLPVKGGLRAFKDEARRAGQPAFWLWRGRPVAAYVPDTSRFGGIEVASTNLLEAVSRDPAALRIDAADPDWIPAETPEDIAAAESRLFNALSHGRDGFISQFDRRISTPISRLLAKTSITPNQITAASLLIGLAGAALVASPGYWICLAGTLVVWASSILDGCDGEIARLKLMTSRGGRIFDLSGDYLANFSLIGAIVLHVARTRPDLKLGLLGVALAVGVSLSGFCAWYFFLRDPRHQPFGLERALQRLASRDFLYVVIPLAALGHLEWFLYGAAVGSNLFWASLLALGTLQRGR